MYREKQNLIHLKDGAKRAGNAYKHKLSFHQRLENYGEIVFKENIFSFIAAEEKVAYKRP